MRLIRRDRNLFRATAAALLLTSAFVAAQTAPSRSVLGTVTGFRVDDRKTELMVKPDDGPVSAIPFTPDTDVIRVAPGEHDLSKGEAARITDVLTGDRVLVSFVEGMAEARRVVLITATDIAKRNEANRLDWQKRGVSGVVESKDGRQLALRVGTDTTTVTVTDQTTIRRYAPDSVRFADATLTGVDAIAPGDQVQARGDKGADGLTLTAQEIVFGTFLTTAGTIEEVQPEANRVTIENLATKQPMTVRLTADTRMRTVPDMQEIMNHMHGGGSGVEHHDAPPPAGARMAQMIDMLPPARMADLKPGETVVVTSTKGAASDEVTAIVFLAHADFVARMIQAAAHGGQGADDSPDMSEILRRHGVKPGGSLNIPAIIP